MKYEITPQTPEFLLKNFTFFFTKYNNDWKECKFWRQKNQKK